MAGKIICARVHFTTIFLILERPRKQEQNPLRIVWGASINCCGLGQLWNDILLFPALSRVPNANITDVPSHCRNHVAQCLQSMVSTGHPCCGHIGIQGQSSQKGAQAVVHRHRRSRLSSLLLLDMCGHGPKIPQNLRDPAGTPSHAPLKGQRSFLGPGRWAH